MDKLQLAIRRNNKSNEIKNCKHLFAALLGRSMADEDFLSLEETDLLTTKFYDSYRDCTDKLCEKYISGNDQFEVRIRELAIEFAGISAYLITKQTEICGLITIPVDLALNKYSSIIEMDGDSVCLLSADEKKGIYIDYFEEGNEQGSAMYFEVCIWNL